MKYLLSFVLAMNAAQVEAGIFGKFLRSRSRPNAAAKAQPAKAPAYRMECNGTSCRRVPVK